MRHTARQSCSGAVLCCAGIVAAAISMGAAGQGSYRLDKIRDVFELDDLRILSLGDSFGVANSRNIVPKFLDTWPVNLTAIQAGARQSPFCGYNAYVTASQVDVSGTYEILRCTEGEEFFALPIHSIREVCGPVSGNLFTLASPKLTPPLRWRPTLWSADTKQVFPGVEVDGNLLTISDDVAEGEYFHLAGAVSMELDEEGERLPGLYFSTLADSSWSWWGLGDDAPALHGVHKTFTREQLRHWLAATTIDLQQPMYVFYNLATENRTDEVMLEDLSNAVDQTQLAADEVGIETVWHCIIIPHMHILYNLNEADSRDAFARFESAALQVAVARPNVSVMSLYSGLNKVFFDGRAEAHQWLIDHEYEEITWGGNTVNLIDEYNADLLDWPRAHVDSADAGAFFAMVALDLVNAAVRGDLNADQQVDLDDLLLVISRWGFPFDLDDLLDVISNWGAGGSSR